MYESEADDAALKLADFGFAVAHGGKGLQDACGSPAYVAPEVIEGRLYGPPVDMWSIGVIAFILLSGEMPFGADDETELFDQILHARYTFGADQWSRVSLEAKNFVRNLLVVEPERRMTAEQVR